MEFAVRGLLTRGPSLGFHDLSIDYYAHPERDPGCFLRGHDFLRPFCRQYRHAMVMLDREGCGRSDWPANAWSRKSKIVWLLPGGASGGCHCPRSRTGNLGVERFTGSGVRAGWVGRQPRLADWLRDEGHLTAGQPKPQDPKRAVEEALRIVRKQRSSAIYLHLAQRVSVHRCVYEAFLKFKTLLQQWFGGERT